MLGNWLQGFLGSLLSGFPHAQVVMTMKMMSSCSLLMTFGSLEYLPVITAIVFLFIVIYRWEIPEIAKEKRNRRWSRKNFA